MVERKKPEKICFGAHGERVTTFMGKTVGDVSPATYDLSQATSCAFRLLNKVFTVLILQFCFIQNFKLIMGKVRSRKGVGGLASEVPRFKRKILMQIPSPTRYDLRKQYDTTGKGFVPFGSNVKRHMKINNLPGYSKDTSSHFVTSK